MGWQTSGDLGSHMLKMAEPPSAWVLVWLCGIELLTWTAMDCYISIVWSPMHVYVYSYIYMSIPECMQSLTGTPRVWAVREFLCVCPQIQCLFLVWLTKVLCSVSSHTLVERGPPQSLHHREPRICVLCVYHPWQLDHQPAATVNTCRFWILDYSSPWAYETRLCAPLPHLPGALGFIWKFGRERILLLH